MITRIFSALFALILMIVGNGVPVGQKCDAKFTGSFIQSWLCLWWDEDTWQQEIKYMKEAGISTLILQDVATFSDKENAVLHYPSTLPCFADCEKYGDVIGDILRACKGNDIDVYIGLAVFDDWWTFAGFSNEYMTVCQKSAQMAEEIYNKYYPGYEDTFKGWYFAPEINNLSAMKLSIDFIINGFNLIIDEVNNLNPSMPMLLSPYYSEYLSVPSVIAALPMWVRFVNKAHFRDGDIFCPQDAIGAQWTKPSSLEKVWQMYTAAVQSCPKNLHLWANCENMTVARDEQLFMPPATVEKTNQTATLDRFVRQMEIASRYAENIITFSYNHYYSPVSVSSVYHETYLDYLANGYLETQAPSAVTGFCRQNNIATWNAASDNIGIAYYLVSTDGIVTARIEADSVLQYPVDVDHTYGIQAVDAAGNTSETVFLSDF